MTTTNRLIHHDTARVKQLSQEISALVVGMSISIVAVYLYGSWGSEYECADSDIDLAVLAQGPLSLDDRLQLAQRVSCLDDVQHDCDLVDLWSADTVFAALVITGGQRLFTAGVAADRFEVKTLSSYARLNEERGAILRDIVERGSVYHVQTRELS